MKVMFNIVKILILFLFIAGVFILLINKTFIHETYKDESMDGEGIKVSRFMYYTGLNKKDNLTGTFITPLNNNILETYRTNYLNSLSTCYGKYYYDEDNDITILNYDIIDNGLYRSVSINYSSKNYCSDEYLLHESWAIDYLNHGEYISGDLTDAYARALITVLSTTEQVANIIIDDDYKSSISLNVEYSDEKGKYTLTFSDFNENQLLVVKTYDDGDTQFVVYEINSVVSYLKTFS